MEELPIFKETFPKRRNVIKEAADF